MKLRTARLSLSLSIAAMFAGPYALADDAGWYAGADVGRSQAKIDDARITSGLLGAGFATTGISDRDRDTGYKVFGGYQFNRNFALEAGYFDLGKFGYTATTTPAGTLDGSIKLKGFNLDLVGTLPLAAKFSVFGRVGVADAQARDNFSGTGAVNVTNPSPSQRATNLKYGLGLQYDLTRSLATRIEGERYRIDDAVGNKGDINLISVGVVYRFGAKTPAPAPSPMPVSAPAPVAPPPAPQPAVVAPPPPAPVKVTFSADALFDFDRAILKPAGKAALDKFAADLRGGSFDAIRVTGYTDRIGSHDYNMKLSQRRADAVSAYLAQSGGIAAGKISARGADGSDPVTKPGECKGTKKTPRLIACLQPDRRVDVEVTATR
jgi:OmpA-OmpF porin, OOP family